ncbi:cytosolic 5'-nucleotidase 3-like isoform X2 [Ctenopharyngodon idella]|uniref:cytosolic 5'-nucleotidase 3-like isoform X2 n=1 Tax=Ctenopharyngodon idella TaxID=7959 RepID=UPI002232450E|nr:cytosolic 5'-nucleotidase 3-like isoform X2 [Ctenopharyngodon idella]
MIPQLSKSSVSMRDPERVEQILTSMREAGSSTLQVISDFDMTLTRFAYNGQRCPTCHNILENSKLISEDCKAKLQKLLDTYYPIEIDSTRSVEEKLPLMVEWWTKAHDLLVQQKISKDHLARVVKESEAMLRDGYQQFFGHLHQMSVPLLIFSAGIGDVLEEVIRQAGVFHPNVKVFSNYMDFDDSVHRSQPDPGRIQVRPRTCTLTRPQRSPEVSAEIESTRSSTVRASSTRQPRHSSSTTVHTGVMNTILNWMELK